MKKVIIVGNGPSIKENGESIDSFDIVVRFNNFKTKDFEKYTGIKTNYWFNTISEHKLEETPERIVWHSWHWDKLTDTRYQSLLKSHPNIEKTTRETIVEMQEYTNDKSYFNYSTGAIAIWMLLKEVDHVTVTGFDWWQKKDKHHYHNNGGRGTIHKPEKEWVFVSKLINEKRLSFL